MPKNKPHKGALKRVKLTKTGKVRAKTAWGSHLLSHKSPTRRRRLRKTKFLSNSEAKRFSRLLHRRLRGRTQPRTSLRRSPSPAQRAETRVAQESGAS